MKNYLVTIGLEVHVQLKTRSKMFCGCPVEFGAEPNTHTCPVCLGMPGALPVMNHQALKLTALTGLMLGCQIPTVCKFDRKNYFYPDMPKNYQISQYDMPLCLGGGVPLHALAYPKDVQKEMEGKDKVIPLTRIHLEEDVAKSFHFDSSTGIDFNRAGTPLMEIVSDPEISTPEEAFAYLTSLKQILHYGGVSDADMEKGQMRCDCNISLRPEGQDEFGTKIEIKNMNTISGVRRALAFEIERQTACLERGETLLQETRRWNDETGQTDLMRIKESAHDYRYFPDPDLLPVQTEAIVAEVRPLVPELPTEKRVRFTEQYGVSPYDAGVLANDLPLAAYFEKAASSAAKPKMVANWILNELPNLLNAAGLSIAECPIAPEGLHELVAFIDEGKISGKQGKEVFAEMFATGKAAAVIIEEKGLKQESDLGAIEALCDQAIADNPKAVAEYKSGKLASINFLKGQVMKLSKGKANPGLAGDVLARKLA
ncbi:MAG: Asp-tRNA(Asn)/Glu-tRNA(Gln) amidotransferase subunit GatB [Verrucomicrobiota bacterium]